MIVYLFRLFLLFLIACSIFALYLTFFYCFDTNYERIFGMQGV